MRPLISRPVRSSHKPDRTLGDGPPSGRPLDVALVSTTALSTPPEAYGGTELVVAELARGLSDLGHRPTVFATGNSRCAGALRSVIEHPVWPPDELVELRHAAFAWREIATGRFDVVHVNHAAAIPFSTLVGCATVATVHHDRDDALVNHYASYPGVSYVAISARQRELSPEIPFDAVIHHGLGVDAYPAGVGAGGYCTFLGRLAPVKGAHIAIDVAHAASMPIRLGGEAHAVARAYFDAELVPRLRQPGVEWLGEVGGERKLSLLGDASCTLFPIEWEEPFGLVVIESMLVGTPVVAFARGSIPEIVDEGVTGYVVDTAEQMAERVRQIHRIDRKRCRARARERFDAWRMSRAYVELYRRVLAAREVPSMQATTFPGGAHGRTRLRAER